MTLRLSPEDYAELKQYIFRRDGFRCRHCGYRNNLHCHHIQYRSQGGSDEDWNLCTLCMACHDGIHLGGLTIVEPANAEEKLVFIRSNEWKPS